MTETGATFDPEDKRWEIDGTWVPDYADEVETWIHYEYIGGQTHPVPTVFAGPLIPFPGPNPNRPPTPPGEKNRRVAPHNPRRISSGRPGSTTGSFGGAAGAALAVGAAAVTGVTVGVAINEQLSGESREFIGDVMLETTNDVITLFGAAPWAPFDTPW